MGGMKEGKRSRVSSNRRASNVGFPCKELDRSSRFLSAGFLPGLDPRVKVAVFRRVAFSKNAQPVKSGSRNTAGSMKRLKAAFFNSFETPKVDSQIGQDGEIFDPSPS